jgi:hypothetical protein
LEEKLNTVTNYLGYESNVTTKKQIHNRKKVNPEAEDETLENVAERTITYPVNTLVDFVVHLINEKQKLADAITSAKKTCDIDIDSAVSLNKRRQIVAQRFIQMGNIKATEKINPRAIGYKFNNEGNQVTYNYEIKEITSIDFDRNKVKAAAKSLIKNSDDISTALDKIMIETEVTYTPIYDISDSLDDILAQYAKEIAVS